MMLRAAFVVMSVGTALWAGATLTSGRQLVAESAEFAAIQALIDDGHYADAETQARALYSRLSANGTSSPLVTARASDFLVGTLILNGKSGAPETQPLAEHVIDAKQAALGREDLELVPSLRNLGDILARKGDYQASIAILERAERLRPRTDGSHALELAAVDDCLARSLGLTERFDEALRVIDRGLTVKEAVLPPRDIRIARSLEVRAWLLQRRGDYSSSRQSLARALTIRESGNPKNPEMASSISLLGYQQWFEGDLLQARRNHQRAITLAEEVLGTDHSELVVYLQRQALVLTDLGDWAATRALLQRALTIGERSFGYDRSGGFNLTNDLANTYYNAGDYAVARSFYEQALSSERQAGHATDSVTATIIYNLALVDRRLGNLTEARREFVTAAAILQRARGPSHPSVARVHSALADLLRDQGLNTQAETHFRRALVIRERSLGPNHRDVARSLSNLAVTLARLGKMNEALALSNRALEIRRRPEISDPIGLADALIAHGSIEAQRGNQPGARESYERAATIRQEVLGPSHPDVAEADAGLGAAFARMGETSQSLRASLDAESIGRNHLRLSLQNLAERQALEYAAKRPKGLDLALSVATAVPDSSVVFDAVIRNRALVLDEMAARHQEAADAHRPDVEPLRTALTSARQRLANLVVKGPSDRQPMQYVQLVDEARREKEKAERALAEVSTTFKNELVRNEVGLDQVRTALPMGSALIAFVRYDRTLLPASSAAAPPTAPAAKTARPGGAVPSYLAFVVRPGDGNISMVRLGAASSLDSLVARWRNEATGVLRISSPVEAERSYRAAGSALRQRVWDPLTPYLKDVATVLVVPDGALNVLTLAALPVGRTEYLIDRAPVIHYLTAERDLVAAPPRANTSRGLLALGGAAFDDATLFARGNKAVAPLQRSAVNQSAVAGQLRESCGSLQSMQFVPLDGTRQEVRQVASLWTDSPAQVLEGKNASERAFKRDAPGHRVLHLATHGFFLGTGCSPAGGGTRSVGGLAVALPRKPVQAGLSENPLLLSGLALAGANRRASAGPGDEDGILTAEEVATLDLQGVEWAVLSACDTGLGEVRAGEGVFGLRRAFQVAGVRTVIMSLWPVQDEGTREWMRVLYDTRLRKGLDTANAVRQASLVVLNNRRAKHESTHPFFWGAFVGAGDWR